MTQQLKKYRDKRDFNETGEPSGSGKKTAKQQKKKLIFCVQYHSASKDHFDFRLEYNGVLLSWAVPKGPSANPRDKRLAVQVEDHPVEYADFEGIIPKGQYGGGTVMLWDKGYYSPSLDFKSGLTEGSIKFELFGRRLQGKWALVRLKDEKQNNWLLIKDRDVYASDSGFQAKSMTSVLSGRTMDEIAGNQPMKKDKNPFQNFDAQLAELRDQVPEDDDYLYEIKYDGYRIAAFIEAGRTRLITRGGQDYTQKFGAAASALGEFAKGRSMILDGEMVALDKEGRADFSALTSFQSRENPDKSLVYMMFDLLALDGKDLRGLALLERKNKLEGLCGQLPYGLMCVKYTAGQGAQLFEAAAEMQLEGLIGKKASSPYRGGRSADWIKLKCYRRQEFVIGGFVSKQNSPETISALMLGVYEGDKFTYIGRAGTGLNARERLQLKQRAQNLARKTSPFFNLPPIQKGEEVCWLSPRLVAEIQYAELTPNHTLRQASFKGLREDKAPKAVRLEALGGKGKRKLSPKNIAAAKEKKKAPVKTPQDALLEVKFTSPQREVFTQPIVKKIDVANYYMTVAPRMLKFVAHRIVSVVRVHKGVEQGGFFKKHPDGKNLGQSIIRVEGDEKTHEYFALDDERGILSEVQKGTVEFHIWASLAKSYDVPDTMVFDLDPDEGMGLKEVRRGVKDLKSILDGLGLKSFLKVSGGKGYHIVVPFCNCPDWETFRAFAQKTALVMQTKWPELYTVNSRKINRRGKIFIDFMRNTRGATSVAPYSLRARKGAKVSMPISWKELDTVPPDGIDIFEAEARLAKADPWKNYFTVQHKQQFFSPPEKR